MARARGQAFVADVLDVGVAVGQALDPVDVEVEADDVVADLDRPEGQGQADIALARRRPAWRWARRSWLGPRRVGGFVGDRSGRSRPDLVDDRSRVAAR